MSPSWVEYGYILASILFISGIKMLGRPGTARRGNFISSLGMLTAVLITLAAGGLEYRWIVVGVLIGSVAGIAGAKLVKMTAMPEMVALFNGFGGIASLLVGWSEFHRQPLDLFTSGAVSFAVIIGGITFTGSIVAWGKLSGVFSGSPVVIKGQHIVNGIVLVSAVVLGIVFTGFADAGYSYTLFLSMASLALVLGILAVIPIGGADMPVVISLLNSFSGLAACAAGFIILNTVLIVAGALVGASGVILTLIMGKAMNRSLANVLFSGFGSIKAKTRDESSRGTVRPLSAKDAYYILEAARSVVIVPGYGMAVAQAQHAVRELGDLLEKNGTEVRYAIHPVAGRMPGHMNVLLAEADVPYEQLVEMEDVNRSMNTVDVCLVIGANDVVNPAAREDTSSPIYGMPIINADHAKTVIIMKRSLASGFAGIDNPLFWHENTRMLFGDAKAAVQSIIIEFKGT